LQHFRLPFGAGILEFIPPQAELVTHFAAGAAQQQKVEPGAEARLFQQTERAMSGALFEAELEIARGAGYLTSEEIRARMNLPMDFIPMDALFSPIQKVHYAVENARVGQRTDYDRLVLEVWTDGSITPENAIAYASKILKEHLSMFINFEEEPAGQEEKSADEAPTFNENLYRSVNELELSVRAANCLRNATIRYIGELVQKTEQEMLKTKNFGRKSLNEIKEILTEMGLHLGMKLESFSPPDHMPERKEDVA